MDPQSTEQLLQDIVQKSSGIRSLVMDLENLQEEMASNISPNASQNSMMSMLCRELFQETQVTKLSSVNETMDLILQDLQECKQRHKDILKRMRIHNTTSDVSTCVYMYTKSM